MNFTSEIVSPFIEKRARLSAGERIELPANTVKDKTHTVFSARLASLSGGKLIVGHGYSERCAGWIEIDDKCIRAFNYYTFKDPMVWPITESVCHGLDIADFITVIIDKDAVHGENARIISKSGSFTCSVEGLAGYYGSPLAFADTAELSDCTLSFTSEAYAAPVWLYGDSYLNHLSPDRWPYYLYKDGFTDVLLSGFPGEGAASAIVDFELALTKGTPHFALWLLGMNNGEGESSEPNPNWLQATERFLSLCRERGITPVLATIPSTPKINNDPKNRWVRQSGERFIDFEKAVGADIDKAWYPEMLSEDLVHPLDKGGEALYSRVLIDFPEIMRR